MNISYQEVLIFAVIALIIVAIVWLIVRIIKGFASGYNETRQPARELAEIGANPVNDMRRAWQHISNPNQERSGGSV